MDQLQLLVLSRLAALGAPGAPLSARAAARRSEGRVSHHTVNAIATGTHKGGITPRIAEGLAVALDVQASQIYDAAGMPRPQGRWVMPERFDRLDAEQRSLIEAMAAALLNAHTKGYEQGRTAE